MFILILTLFGFIKEKAEWSVFPGLAIILGLFFHTALLADGSITQVSGGTVTAIATASTDSASIWQALQWIPLMLTVTSFFIVTYRVGTALKG